MLALQEMMEKVVLLRKAVEQQRKQYDPSTSATLNSKLRQYAALLAGQGCLSTAYSYIMQDGEVHVRVREAVCLDGPFAKCTLNLCVFLSPGC